MSTPRIAALRVAAGLVLAAAPLAACGSGARDPAPAPAPESETQIGYGSQPKERVTGAIASVDEETIDRRQATSIAELLQNVPGVSVTRTGSGFSVRVRGAGSFMGDGEPLFVVDGVPLQSSTDGAFGINPSDVKRIEVLKDAAATAIYGLRGGNGVILITTKRARR